MIEVTILNHLKTKLSVPVRLEKPDPAPVEYVLFLKRQAVIEIITY